MSLVVVVVVENENHSVEHATFRPVVAACNSKLESDSNSNELQLEEEKSVTETRATMPSPPSRDSRRVRGVAVPSTGVTIDLKIDNL